MKYTKEYFEGLREGVRMFAWWKDATQYVGTCGKTLKEALEEIDQEEVKMGPSSKGKDISLSS